MNYDETVLPCPFCGVLPQILPKDWETEGDGFGGVRCVNEKCYVQPSVLDGLECASDGLPEGAPESAHSGLSTSLNCQNAAIRRWNKRRLEMNELL